ncbi:hypothetical protein Bbelb_101280 [Branchiostoma belcheri]|nr:hypothetical protein Bbelb_101280 [Branchiostoma belcheri]
MSDLRGKVAIITGASSGIGKGAAVEFAQLGAHLALTGRNQETCRPQQRPILLVTGDICDEEVRKNLVDQTVQKFGRIDVLVNNAGSFMRGTLETTAMADYDRIMDVNVRSVVRLTQLCIPHLTKTKEQASRQIRVNSVNPGVILTEIFRRTGLNDEEKHAKYMEHHKTTHPLGRVGDALEVAKTIAFLASSDASFITGTLVSVDGGRHAFCPC